MRNCLLILSLLPAAGLYGQYGHQRFSWQDACFNNPTLPYCQGHDSAVKRHPKGKDDAAGSVVTSPDDLRVDNVTPAEVAGGAIDWRFADPAAAALVGFHARKLSALPLARQIIAQLGASQGLEPAQIDKILERMSTVDQVAISIGADKTVLMLTARAADSVLPALQPGWKAVTVLGNAVLIGSSGAVDEAAQRLGLDVAPGQSMIMAMRRQQENDFWAMVSADIAGPQAANTNLKRFTLTACLSDRLASDLTIEFTGAPGADALASLPPMLKGEIEGNAVHIRTSMDAAQVRGGFALVAGSPIGERLNELLRAAKYLPARDTSAPKKAKPTIYGLEGGPKEVN
jgi:hypothetical protein